MESRLAYLDNEFKNVVEQIGDLAETIAGNEKLSSVDLRRVLRLDSLTMKK